VYAGLFPDELDAVADALDGVVPQMCHDVISQPDNNDLTEQLNLF